MNKLQLYIEGNRVDLYPDESISVTSSIQNTRDISKIYTDFSQDFTVPATKINNRIFKHYYRFEILDGFDARFKKDARLEINHTLFRKGRIRLLGVNMKDNNPHSYRLVFYGNTVTLPDLFGDDRLDSLQFLDNFSDFYNFTEVVGKLSNGNDVTVGSETFTDALITPLISAKDRWYYDSSDTTSAGTGNLYPSASLERGADWQNLKYAIRLHCIIKAIEDKYGITFSTDFFNTTNTDYYNLYMWLHREKGQILASSDLSDKLNKFPSATLGGLFMSSDHFDIRDSYSNYGFQTVYATVLNLDVSSAGATFNVVLKLDGQEVQRFDDKTGATSYAIDFGDLNANGSYTIEVEYTSAFTVQSTSDLTIQRISKEELGASTIYSFTNNQTLGSDFTFHVTNQMPRIKVLDFLTGLFKMFNLTAYEEQGTIVIDTLDSFYTNGGFYDITKYVSTEFLTVDSTVQYKQLNFEYSGLSSLFANQHSEAFNVDWSTLEYNAGEKYVGGKYTIQIPFEHHKYERIVDDNTGSSTTAQWGWSVDKLNDDGSGQEYLGQPLLFYPIKQTSGTQIRIYQSGGYTDVTDYYIPSNSVSITTSNSINFRAEINEYSRTIFYDTLFANFYQTYISRVFDQQARLVTVKAYLPSRIINTYKLNDEIQLWGKQYTINSIQSDLTTGESKIELINKL